MALWFRHESRSCCRVALYVRFVARNGNELVCHYFIKMLLAPLNQRHDGWHQRLAGVSQ